MLLNIIKVPLIVAVLGNDVPQIDNRVRIYLLPMIILPSITSDFPIRDNVVICRDEYELRYDSSTFDTIGLGATGAITSITEIRSNRSYALKKIPTCCSSKSG